MLKDKLRARTQGAVKFITTDKNGKQDEHK
jgi:hypothetical protein